MSHPTITVDNQPGTRGSQVRLFKADRYSNRIEEIEIKDPVSGTITYNEDVEIKQQLSLNVAEVEAWNPLRDFIIPELTEVYADGSSITRDFGTYLVMPSTAEMRATRRFGTLEGKDLTYLLRKSTVTGLIASAGQDGGEAMRNIVLGGGFMASQIDIADSGIMMADDVFADPGMSRMAALTKISELMNWYVPWMSNDHQITSKLRTDLSQRSPSKSYSTLGENVELLPPIIEQPDFTRLRNKVTVRKLASGEEEEDIWATVRIENRDHKLFYDPTDPDAGCGMEYADDPIDDPNITSVEEATAKAMALLSEQASFYQKLTVRTTVDFDVSAHDVIGLDAYIGNQLVYHGNWWRRTWQLSLSGIVSTMVSEVYRVEQIR